MRLMKAIKKVAAIGTGLGFLGATFTGALAADLADYPAPFVSDGKFVNVALVVGDASTGEDTLALTSISTKLQQVVTSEAVGNGGVTVVGGISEDIPLGINLAGGGGSSQFDYELDDSDLDHFFDEEVTFQSSEYNVKEVLELGLYNNVSYQTSLTSSEDDYETEIRMEIIKDAIKYFYVFDETIEVNASTTAKPLKLNFLGQQIKIKNVDSASKFTATVGTEYFMKIDESVTIDSHTVTLSEVGSGDSVVVEIGGIQKTISSGETEDWSDDGIDLEVYNDEVFYDANNREVRSATLIIGEDAEKSYTDGDPYIGEDTDDPDWIWDIGNLETKSSTTITNNATTAMSVTGPYIGIENDFLYDDFNDNPPSVGECINLPNNYVQICYDSLTVDDDEYMHLEIKFENSCDFSDAYYSGKTSEACFEITVDEDEGLKLLSSKLSNLSSDVKTDEVYLDAETQNVSVYYKDTNNKIRWAGNLTETTDDVVDGFMEINYKDTKSTNIAFTLIGDVATADTLNLTLNITADTSSDLAANDDLTIWLGHGAGGPFDALGTGKSTQEADEIKWQSSTGSAIGTKDEDHRNYYGVIIRDPKSNGGSSDKVILEIPGDQVQVWTTIKGQSTGATAAATSTSAPTAVTASEITTKTAYNIVLVGGPCVNELSADFLGVTYPACGAASGIDENTAIIELKDNNGKSALVVAGWEAADTRRAGVVLANYDSFALTGTSATVKGTGLAVSGITVE